MADDPDGRMGGLESVLHDLGWYLDLGLKVVPTDAARQPHVKYWTAMSTQEVAKAVPGWVERFRDAYWAVLTGGRLRLVVIDEDAPAAARRYLDMPDDWEVETPHGTHLWVRWPRTVQLPATKTRIYPKVDIRATSGLAIIPVGGVPYRWHRRVGPLPPVLNPGVAATLLELAPRSAPERQGASLDKWWAARLLKLEGTAVGSRHDEMVRAARALGGRVHLLSDPAQAERDLIEAGVAMGVPDKEVRAIVRWGLDKGGQNKVTICAGGPALSARPHTEAGARLKDRLVRTRRPGKAGATDLLVLSALVRIKEAYEPSWDGRPVFTVQASTYQVAEQAGKYQNRVRISAERLEADGIISRETSGHESTIWHVDLTQLWPNDAAVGLNSVISLSGPPLRDDTVTSDDPDTALYRHIIGPGGDAVRGRDMDFRFLAWLGSRSEVTTADIVQGIGCAQRTAQRIVERMQQYPTEFLYPAGRRGGAPIYEVIPEPERAEQLLDAYKHGGIRHRLLEVMAEHGRRRENFLLRQEYETWKAAAWAKPDAT